MRTVNVETVLEHADPILFAGTVVGGPSDGEKVSFHIPRAGGGDEIRRRLEATVGTDDRVEVQLP